MSTRPPAAAMAPQERPEGPSLPPTPLPFPISPSPPLLALDRALIRETTQRLAAALSPPAAGKRQRHRQRRRRHRRRSRARPAGSSSAHPSGVLAAAAAATGRLGIADRGGGDSSARGESTCRWGRAWRLGAAGRIPRRVLWRLVVDREVAVWGEGGEGGGGEVGVVLGQSAGWCRPRGAILAPSPI